MDKIDYKNIKIDKKKYNQIKNLLLEHLHKLWVDCYFNKTISEKEIEKWYKKSQKELNFTEEEGYKVLYDLVASNEFNKVMKKLKKELDKLSKNQK